MLKFNDVEITGATFNGVTLDKVFFNAIEIFTKNTDVYDIQYFYNSVTYNAGARSAGSNYSFNYSGYSIEVGANPTAFNPFPQWSQILVYVDDVYYTTLTYTGAETKEVVLPAGNKKITLKEGIVSKPTTTIIGTFLTSIALELDKYTPYTEGSTDDKVVFLGDSITVGTSATTPIKEGYAFLFSEENNHDVTCLGWGYGTVKDFAETPLELADLNTWVTASLSNVTSNKRIVIALGTNDYALDSTPVSTFKGWYENLVDEVNIIDSNIEIYCISPLIRVGETSLIQDYRDAIDEVCDVRSYCTYIDGLPILDLSDLADNVHPTTAGHKKYKDYIYNSITEQKYKNVLTDTKDDYLSIGSYNVATLNDIDFEIEVVVNLGGIGGILHIGKSLTDRNGSFSIVNTTTDIIISMRSDSGVQVFSVSSSAAIGDKFNIKLKQSLLYINNTMVSDQSANSGELINALGKPYFVGRYRASTMWRYSNCEAYNLSINGEYFGLNEPSGALITGELGTTGTRITSSLDPNYIDDVMIQAYV